MPCTYLASPSEPGSDPVQITQAEALLPVKRGAYSSSQGVIQHLGDKTWARRQQQPGVWKGTVIPTLFILRKQEWERIPCRPCAAQKDEQAKPSWYHAPALPVLGGVWWWPYDAGLGPG